MPISNESKAVISKRAQIIDSEIAGIDRSIGNFQAQIDALNTKKAALLAEKAKLETDIG